MNMIRYKLIRQSNQIQNYVFTKMLLCITIANSDDWTNWILNLEQIELGKIEKDCKLGSNKSYMESDECSF